MVKQVTKCRHQPVFLVAVVFLIGIVYRVAVSLSSDFPINDGGMFFVMTKDLIKSGFILPFYSSYNSAMIPFTYPPLGVYLAGFLAIIFNVDLIDIFRFLPLAATIFSIPIFYLINRQLFSEKIAVSSLLIFAVSIRSFRWQIMGGGVTRSVGFLISLITLYFFVIFAKRNSKICFWLTALGVALVILSHFEWALFIYYSLPIVYLGLKGSKQLLLALVKILLLGFALTIFWWLLVVGRHGFAPFVSFLTCGIVPREIDYYLRLISLRFMDEVFVFPIIGLMIFFGMVIAVRRKNIWLLLWLIIPFLVAPRGAPSLAAIPASILAGFFISKLLFQTSNLRNTKLLAKSGLKKLIIYKWRFWAVTAFFVIYPLLSFFLASSYLLFFPQLSQEDREVMEWVKSHTEPESRFLILSRLPPGYWAEDNFSEWFPALTERVSIFTPQGYEWFPGGVFKGRIKMKNEFRETIDRNDLSLLEELTIKYSLDYDYVLLDRKRDVIGDGPIAIKKVLAESPEYDEVYNHGNILIFKDLK